MSVFYLNAPLTREDVEQLRIGDTVYISGKAFTCRSRLQKWVFDEKNELPFETKNQNVLIHTGPIILNDDGNWKLVSFMPTSSIRFEKWGARSIDQWGLRMIIGKTTMGEETMQMMVEKGCVHVSPQCVSPNLWIDSIKVDGVDLYKELGAIEATWHFSLYELGPFIVDIDCEGNNLYKEREADVNKKRDEVLNSMGIGDDYEFTKLY